MPTLCEIIVHNINQMISTRTKIVPGATKLVSINSRLSDTCWETLGSRRKTHKLTMFYNTQNGLCPDYLTSLVPAAVGSASTFPLRTSIVFKHYMHILVSTIHLSCRLLSVIGMNFQSKTRNVSNLNIFKNRLNTNLSTPPVTIPQLKT